MGHPDGILRLDQRTSPLFDYIRSPHTIGPAQPFLPLSGTSTLTNRALMEPLVPHIDWTPERIRAFRAHFGENQTQFARRLAYASGAKNISNLERGATLSPQAEMLLDLWADRVGWEPSGVLK